MSSVTKARLIVLINAELIQRTRWKGNISTHGGIASTCTCDEHSDFYARHFPRLNRMQVKSPVTLPVPGGPASRTALPAIFLLLISSTITPHACNLKGGKRRHGLKMVNMHKTWALIDQKRLRQNKNNVLTDLRPPTSTEDLCLVL